MGQRQVSDGNAPKSMGFVLPSPGESAGRGASLVRAGKVDFLVGNGCARTIASPWAGAKVASFTLYHNRRTNWVNLA